MLYFVLLYNYKLKTCLYYKKIKAFFNVGNIYKVNNKGHVIFVVNYIKDLNNLIIRHFY